MKEALQKVEASGIVEYTLGGHRCERPPEVAQGLSEDAFNISPDGDNSLLWRANQIQTKSLKQSNVASHFPFSMLSQSALTLVSQHCLGSLMFSIFCMCCGNGLNKGVEITFQSLMGNKGYIIQLYSHGHFIDLRCGVFGFTQPKNVLQRPSRCIISVEILNFPRMSAVALCES